MFMKRQARMGTSLALSLLLCGCSTLPAQAAEAALDVQSSAYVQEDGRVWVRFDANGGSGTLPDSMAAQKGEGLTLPSAQLTVRIDGETLRFVGWSTRLTDSLPEYEPGSIITLGEDTTLYAVYASGECQVTYRVNGVTTTEEVTLGETPKEVPALPEGYMGWVSGSGAVVDPASTQIWGDQTFTAYEAITLNTWDHSKYMDGSSDGLFHPGQYMTRAEVAQVLYGLLAEEPEARVSFTDVSDDMWYAEAVESLGAMGILDCEAGSAFRPNAAISRGEFALMLSHFISGTGDLESFADVPAGSRYYEAAGAAAAAGLFSGYADGTFRPDDALTRAQAAVVFNNLLHREADASAIAGNPNVRLFPDVPTTYWAYGEIMEATISHAYDDSTGRETWTQVTAERSALSDGYYRINGRLYRVQNGMFLRNTTVDGFTYDAQGRYTTGSASLDTKLNNIVETYTNSSMTRDQKLRALYNYVRDNFSYLKRDLVSKGETGWEPAYAEEFLNLRRGNCYSFSATYCLLARELGLPAYTVVGGLGASNSPHGWVEINLDGTTYMFDPQLEWRYLHDYGRTGYNLFKMLPSQARFTYIR